MNNKFLYHVRAHKLASLFKNEFAIGPEMNKGNTNCIAIRMIIIGNRLIK